MSKQMYIWTFMAKPLKRENFLFVFSVSDGTLYKFGAIHPPVQ